jgi:hypothetical protein
MPYAIISNAVSACNVAAQLGTKCRAHLEHDPVGQICAKWLHAERARLFGQKQLFTRLVQITAVIDTLMLPVSACSSRYAIDVGRFGVTRATHAGYANSEFRVR